MIGSLKRMVTIFWSRFGFRLIRLIRVIRVIRILPKGAHFDATYFRDNIVYDIHCTRPTSSEEDDRRKLVLYFDNARSHTAGCITAYCRERRMTRANHPAFSPDLAPSDFYLFEKLKKHMKGCVFEDENELFVSTMIELNKVNREELEVVFAEWLLRLYRCINRKRDYLDYAEPNCFIRI
jgi:histone-lysine N-methyltransferase SETMAR